MELQRERDRRLRSIGIEIESGDPKGLLTRTHHGPARGTALVDGGERAVAICSWGVHSLARGRCWCGDGLQKARVWRVGALGVIPVHRTEPSRLRRCCTTAEPMRFVWGGTTTSSIFSRAIAMQTMPWLGWNGKKDADSRPRSSFRSREPLSSLSCGPVGPGQQTDRRSPLSVERGSRTGAHLSPWEDWRSSLEGSILSRITSRSRASLQLGLRPIRARARRLPGDTRALLPGARPPAPAL